MRGFVDQIVASAGAESDEVFRFDGASLSRNALCQRAAGFAASLTKLGVGRGDYVGILMLKSLDLPVAIYGVLMSGAAFVPLDPMSPVERLVGIVDQCGAKVLVSHADMAGKSGPVSQATCVEHVVSVGAAMGDNPQIPDRSIDDPAYVLFTSGSTGQPKGMVHTHKSAMSFLNMSAALYGIDRSDRLAGVTPLHFDMGLNDLFAAPMVGATTVYLPDAAPKFPATVAQILADENITMMFTVPFLLTQLADRGALDQHDLAAMRWVVYGGEPMSRAHLPVLQQHMPNVRFSNAFGPAEVNVVTYHHLTKDDIYGSDPIPIGTVCPHAQAHVTEEGELWIATEATMQGYLHRPDLDRNVFTHLSVTGGQQNRYYQTGDLVDVNKEGLFLFSGRRDHQVKIRGNRIELGEVEAALRAHSHVSDAVVLPAPDRQTLSAFVTLMPGQAVEESDLKSMLGAALPPYAVPHHVEILDAFPRTATGKVDKVSLGGK